MRLAVFLDAIGEGLKSLAYRIKKNRKARDFSPQYSVLATDPPRSSRIERKLCRRASTCCAEISCRARKTCSYRGMKCLSFFICSGAKPRLGALEGKAQETTRERRHGRVAFYACRSNDWSGPPFSLRPERLLVAVL